MKNKSHDRSPEKQGFSVALPKKLVADIQKIAKSETRSRNRQIEKFLEDSVAAYFIRNKSNEAVPPQNQSRNPDHKPPDRRGRDRRLPIARKQELNIPSSATLVCESPPPRPPSK